MLCISRISTLYRYILYLYKKMYCSVRILPSHLRPCLLFKILFRKMGKKSKKKKCKKLSSYSSEEDEKVRRHSSCIVNKILYFNTCNFVSHYQSIWLCNIYICCMFCFSGMSVGASLQ